MRRTPGHQKDTRLSSSNKCVDSIPIAANNLIDGKRYPVAAAPPAGRSAEDGNHDDTHTTELFDQPGDSAPLGENEKVGILNV
jgi:hypothetical protein